MTNALGELRSWTVAPALREGASAVLRFADIDGDGRDGRDDVCAIVTEGVGSRPSRLA